MAKGSMPPGPRSPALVQALVMSRDPIAFLRRCAERYGDMVTTMFPFFGRLVYVSDPVLIKQIFTGDARVLHAGEANALPLGPVMGRYSLLTLDEDEHMRQRKLLLPPFHGEAVRRYADVMADIAATEVDRWPVGRPFALRDRTTAITLEVILRTVFGVQDEGRLERFRAVLPRLGEASNIVAWLPPLRRNFGRWSPAARFERVKAAVDELIFGELAQRRADPEVAERDDVLSLLLQATHEDGRSMSDEELRDELLTLLGAGHETTATALAWAFERVLREPRVLERLLASLDEGDEYLEAVIKETLRVRPVITDVARKLTADYEIGGYTLPAGTLVLPSIAPVHYRTDVYPDPDAFRPERFLDDQPEPYTWLPFGGGVRRCIGAAFATMEMKVVMRTILERVRLRAVSQRPEAPRVRHVTIVPSRGCRVVVERRLARQPDEPAAAVAA
jgi:cytochrome P450